MKERLLAELDDRIARHVNGDSSGVLDETALALVSELTGLGDPDAGSLVRVAGLHLCRYEALPAQDGAADLRLALALFTSLHAVDPRLVPPPIREFLGLAAPHDIALELLREYQRAGHPDHLERAISLLRQEVLDSGPDPAAARCSLGMALLRRFELTGEPSDVDEAVALYRAVVAATPAGHPRLAAYQADLARAVRVLTG
jgi:hypothetical protein